MRRTMFLAPAVALLSLAACSKEGGGKPAAARTEPGATAPTRPGASVPGKPAATAAPTSPVLGKPAPDFTLEALDGTKVSLASFKGKVVVLEWFNPGCPYVQRSHTKGSLIDTSKRHLDAGVVWLAINSGGEGKQGHDVSANVDAVKAWSLSHPVLRDPTGAIGKAYGATNTPNMFVVDTAGTVVYAGAIDNSPDGERGAPEGGTLVNHVDAALADLAAGRPVATPLTRPYGVLGQVRLVLTRGALVAALAATGCGRGGDRDDGPAREGARAPRDPLLDVALPAGATRLEGNRFHVDAAALPGCAADGDCAVVADLTATGGFKVNLEYPFKFVPEAGGTVTPTASFAPTGVHTGRLIVRFRRPPTGSVRVAGAFKLSVCSTEQCLIETAPLAVVVP